MIEVDSLFTPNVKYDSWRYLVATPMEHLNGFDNHVIIATDKSMVEERWWRRKDVGIFAPLPFFAPSPPLQPYFTAIILAFGEVPTCR